MYDTVPFEVGGGGGHFNMLDGRTTGLQVHLMSQQAQGNKNPSFMTFYFVEQYCFLRFWIPLEEYQGSCNIISICVEIEHIKTK